MLGSLLNVLHEVCASGDLAVGMLFCRCLRVARDKPATMNNHIKYADLDVQNGLLVGRMFFQPGLNILSGENGTLKTKALQALKTDQATLSDPGSPCRRQAISPKRNAQRRAFRQIFEQSRQQNLKLAGVITERNINDAAFEEYPALGDLFYVVYEDLCKDGGAQIDKMKEAKSEFNSVIQRVFPHYELEAEWNESTGSPDIGIIKNRETKVPVEGLSLGEQEILSLATNIYSSRNMYDVFSIDEPEVHLNWHLEEKLFELFDDYCNEHNRQMVIVTHSRVIFNRRFFPKTQFLYWNDEGRVSFAKDVTDDQRRRIAGDAIEIIRLGSFTKPTFFVEDSAHALVVEELAAVLGADISVTECGNKANVRSLYNHAKKDGDWTSSYFLEDGDNEGHPFPEDDHFIHLEKYCVEAYLLDFRVASNVLGSSERHLKMTLLSAILENRNKIFRKNKFFEFLIDHLSVEHLTPENLSKLDVSEIIGDFVNANGRDLRNYIRAYIQNAHSTITQRRMGIGQAPISWKTATTKDIHFQKTIILFTSKNTA